MQADGLTLFSRTVLIIDTVLIIEASEYRDPNLSYDYPIHLFGEISRRGEISLKMTNIALVRALRI